MIADNGLVAFMARRQADTESLLDIVSVKWVGGGRPNACFQNAQALASSKDVKVVSGWLALPFDPEHNARHFVQHWWNYMPALKQFVDITPEIEDGSIYIPDLSIARLCVLKNHEFQTQCISTTIVYGNGVFYAVDHSKGQDENSRVLTSLKDDELFPQCFA
ncbi:MAG TPA: hypothetical protein VI279_11090 [Rhodocyclaceae bacterium]